MTLVIMAAGLASRYGSTKQLEGVGPSGELLLEYSVFDAKRAGFTKIVFIVRAAIEAEMRAFVARMPKDLEIVLAVQDLAQVPAWFVVPEGRTKPWGTTHAMLAAKDVVSGPFGILNADDFYGPDAFVQARRACDLAADTGEAAAVLFPLNATLSPNGTVIRGLSRVDGGYLSELEEVRDIGRGPDGLTGRFATGVRPLTGGELASMNFWVFPAQAMGLFTGAFESFLRARGTVDKSESIIPETVAELMAAGALKVRALSAPGPWFGLTHQADRDGVRAGLEKLTHSGVYPRPLWKNEDQ